MPVPLAFVAFAVFNMANSMAMAAQNGKSVWKAAGMSLLSTAATYGIGQAFGGAGGIGKELLRAGAHGLSSGVFNMLDGGSFGSGFASGLTSSGIGSYNQSVRMNPSIMMLSSSAMGGVAAWATGGDFLTGALQGMRIAAFNHAMHIKYYHDKEGNIYGEIPGVECVGHRYSAIGASVAVADAIAVAGTINTFLDHTGKSLKKNSGNSTIGTNGRFYWHAAGKRGFYGNQHVGTIRLMQIGKRITMVTGPVGKAYDGYKIINGLTADIHNYQRGFTDGYNTIRASADVVGGWAGATVGASCGARFGFYVSALTGVGIVPCTIIGGAIGGIAGSFGASWFGTSTVDYIYER